MTYKELKDKQSKLFQNSGVKFAFSQKQFDEMMQDFGLGITEVDKILHVGQGGYIKKEDREHFHKTLDEMDQLQKDAMNEDIDGEGFIADMFEYELGNHEYIITYDIEDTLDACGISVTEFAESEKLQHAFEVARKKYLDAMKKIGY